MQSLTNPAYIEVQNTNSVSKVKESGYSTNLRRHSTLTKDAPAQRMLSSATAQDGGGQCGTHGQRQLSYSDFKEKNK